jgi:hypothetical protein
MTTDQTNTYRIIVRDTDGIEWRGKPVELTPEEAEERSIELADKIAEFDALQLSLDNGDFLILPKRHVQLGVVQRTYPDGGMER